MENYQHDSRLRPRNESSKNCFESLIGSIRLKLKIKIPTRWTIASEISALELDSMLSLFQTWLEMCYDRRQFPIWFVFH